MEAKIRKLLLTFVTIPAGLKLSTWVLTLFEFLTPWLQFQRVLYTEYDQLLAENYLIFKYISVFCVKANSWGKVGQVCRVFLWTWRAGLDADIQTEQKMWSIFCCLTRMFLDRNSNSVVRCALLCGCEDACMPSQKGHITAPMFLRFEAMRCASIFQPIACV